jgi:hypothetical protein
MGSVHARGDTFLTFGLKALTETNTSRLATGVYKIKEGLSRLDDAWILNCQLANTNKMHGIMKVIYNDNRK